MALSEKDRYQLGYNAPLYEELQDMAFRYIKLIQQEVPIKEFARIADTDQRTAMAMAYHDVSWELLRIFTEEKIIERPPAFETTTPVNYVGVCGVVDAYPPFIQLLKEAIASER